MDPRTGRAVLMAKAKTMNTTPSLSAQTVGVSASIINGYTAPELGQQSSNTGSSVRIASHMMISRRDNAVISTQAREMAQIRESGEDSQIRRIQEAAMDDKSDKGGVPLPDEFTLEAQTGSLARSLSREQVGDIAAQMHKLFGLNETASRQLLSETNSTNTNTLQTEALNPTSDTPSNPLADVQTNPEFQSYIALIRMLSKDDEALGKALNQLEEYLAGESPESEGMSLDDMMAKIGEEYQAEQAAQSSASSYVEIRISSRQELEIRMEQNQPVQTSERIVFNTVIAADGTVSVQQVAQGDPLVLDLDGDGIELTSVEEGVSFSLDGTGRTHQTAFVTGGDAFLALDRNGNGVIDSGKELFGEQHGAKDGFEELRKLDDNHDGQIDAQDAVYSQLRLYSEKNMDGISQQDELRTLVEEGVSAISLHAEKENQIIAGNTLDRVASFERVDGSQGIIGDALLNFYV